MNKIVSDVCIHQLKLYGNLFINGKDYKKYGSNTIIDFFYSKGLKVHLDIIDESYIEVAPWATFGSLSKNQSKKELRCIVVLDKIITHEKRM